MAFIQLNLNLFDEFFDVKPGESSTLELFDFCVPFIHQKNVYEQNKLPISEISFFHRGYKFTRQITPAHLKKGDETLEYYPSKREEAVMYVLRYMAAQKQTICNVAEEKGIPLVTIGFTLHQLRNELKRVGRGYNWSEIVEAIEILSKSNLTVSFNMGRTTEVISSGAYLSSLNGINKINEPINRNSYSSDSYRIVNLHPIASTAILSAATRLINYERDMKFRWPLSKYLYRHFVHLCVYAQTPTTEKKPLGIRMTIEEAFKMAGLKRNKSHSDDMKVINKTIKEFMKHGLLYTGMLDYPPYERKGDVYFFYPSYELVKEIVNAHKKEKKIDKDRDIKKAFLPPTE